MLFVCPRPRRRSTRESARSAMFSWWKGSVARRVVLFVTLPAVAAIHAQLFPAPRSVTSTWKDNAPPRKRQ